MEYPTIVLGLGNPGSEYRSTRHNMGFWVVDRLAARADAGFRAAGELKRIVSLTQIILGGREAVLAKPRTYMNRSGRAARELCRHFGVRADELVVVYDDADLELGRLRVRRGGGAGGHNGVRSLVDVLGEDGFVRVRLGIRGTGRDDRPLADYVLTGFDADEAPVAAALAELGADAVESLVRHGLDETMNRFNGVVAEAGGGGSRDS